jgi:hypothetical protein
MLVIVLKQVMENFEISVSYKNENHHFKVKDYMHHEGDQCKFEVFRNTQFIASFEPGPHKHLHICKDNGLLPEEILNLIADRLEASHL